MLQEERKQYILNLLSAKSSVTVAELSKAFQLSEVSVRKMLVKMEEQGEIKRTWGGAVSVEGSLQEYSHSEKVPKYLKKSFQLQKPHMNASMTGMPSCWIPGQPLCR